MSLSLMNMYEFPQWKPFAFFVQGDIALGMPFNWWMDKETVAYTHNGILFSHKEEKYYGICK